MSGSVEFYLYIYIDIDIDIKAALLPRVEMHLFFVNRSFFFPATSASEVSL